MIVEQKFLYLHNEDELARNLWLTCSFLFTFKFIDYGSSTNTVP